MHANRVTKNIECLHHTRVSLIYRILVQRGLTTRLDRVYHSCTIKPLLMHTRSPSVNWAFHRLFAVRSAGQNCACAAVCIRMACVLNPPADTPVAYRMPALQREGRPCLEEHKWCGMGRGLTGIQDASVGRKRVACSQLQANTETGAIAVLSTNNANLLNNQDTIFQQDRSLGRRPPILHHISKFIAVGCLHHARK